MIITNQLSFLKSIRTAIGTSKSISTKARTTQLTSVRTGGFAWSIKLKFRENNKIHFNKKINFTWI
jgi:hypothetical protein